jgi:hypothetical protein
MQDIQDKEPSTDEVQTEYLKKSGRGRDFQQPSRPALEHCVSFAGGKAAGAWC